MKIHFSKGFDQQVYLDHSKASELFDEKVVGQTSIDDCRHIACATVNKVDYLVSWNFKHIVHYEKINGYHAVNLLNGYKQIQIYSPKEVV